MPSFASRNADGLNFSPLLLARLNGFVETIMGLHFPPPRLGDLERGIRSAAGEFGFDTVESCIEWLLTSSLSNSQIDTLANHLTVCETYFFRDRRVFEIVETQVLPEILASRRGRKQHLRIWSAACSSGEEPYSLAILLSRILPDLLDWNISILATDIAPVSLKKAAEGKYREWSFRDAPRWVKARYFDKINQQFEIVSHIKRMVRFSCLNLAEDPYPAIINATNDMDIIFCRNALMYFSRDRANMVIHNLSRCLVDGGWLVVSPVDIPGTEFHSLLRPVRFPGAILYKKEAKPANISAKPATAPAKLTKTEKTPALPAMKRNIQTSSAGHSEHIPLEPERSAGDIGNLVHQARLMANRAEHANALALCEEAMKCAKLNPTLHYLQATVFQEMGRVDDAAAALQRALYIDQDFIIAHFALGHLLHSQGKYKEAGKHLEKAHSLLKLYEPAESIPEAEGISAGRLIELIDSMLNIAGRR